MKPKKPDPRKLASKLREYGFSVSYGKKGKFSAQAKAAVYRTNKKVAKFTENTKQKFTWIPYTKADKRDVRAGLSSQQLTPSGFFLRKGKGSRCNPTLRSISPGVLRRSERGSKGGRMVETIHRISPALLLEDPPRAILAMGKPGDKVVLTVNGFDSSQTQEYSLQALAYYLAMDLLPKFLDPNLDSAYTKAHGKRRGSKRAKLKQFSDIFHVVTRRYEKSIPRAKTKKRKTRRSR